MRLKFATVLMLYVESYAFPFGNTRDDRILEIHFSNNAVQHNTAYYAFSNKYTVKLIHHNFLIKTSH